MTNLDKLRDEASNWLETAPIGLPFRSCWECNGAHEYLRDADYPFACFACGRYLYKGQDITIYEEGDE